MFGRKKTQQTKQTPQATGDKDSTEKSHQQPRGKGRPTPTRREQEAARRRPLVPQDRKAARQASREAAREARIRQNQAMQTGDERHLPVRDKGPQRRFIRDYIDARRNIGDYFLLILLSVFILTIVIPPIQPYATFIMWGLIFLWILDTWLVWRRVKAHLVEKHQKVEPGAAWYAVQRVMMIRRLRLPKPQVARGEYPS